MSFISFLKNRFNRHNVYSSKEYWNDRLKTHKGNSISLWPNNDYNEVCHKDLLKFIDVYMNNNFNGKRVLDLGCGIGRVSRFFACKGADVVGMDFSEKAIEYARSIESKGELSYRVGSVYEWDESEQYDVIFTCGCLVLAAKSENDLVTIFKKFKKALKPNGKLILVEPIHDGFLHRVLKMNIANFLTHLKQEDFKIRNVQDVYCWPARILICNINLPKFLTVLLYTIGEIVVRFIFMSRLFGDYKIIVADK